MTFGGVLGSLTDARAAAMLIGEQARRREERKRGNDQRYLEKFPTVESWSG